MTRHYSVLLQESIDALNCQSDGIYVDGTLGRGGHSLEIARRLQTRRASCNFGGDRRSARQGRPFGERRV